MTADPMPNPLHATDVDAREALLHLARGYNDGSIRAELVHDLVPHYASALAENVFSTFFELVVAVREQDDYNDAADIGQAHTWCSLHNIPREEWLRAGTRLASDVEALLSRLVGGVA